MRQTFLIQTVEILRHQCAEEILRFYLIFQNRYCDLHWRYSWYGSARTSLLYRSVIRLLNRYLCFVSVSGLGMLMVVKSKFPLEGKSSNDCSSFCDGLCYLRILLLSTNSCCRRPWETKSTFAPKCRTFFVSLVTLPRLRSVHVKVELSVAFWDIYLYPAIREHFSAQ